MVKRVVRRIPLLLLTGSCLLPAHEPVDALVFDNEDLLDDANFIAILEIGERETCDTSQGCPVEADLAHYPILNVDTLAGQVLLDVIAPAIQDNVMPALKRFNRGAASELLVVGQDVVAATPSGAAYCGTRPDAPKFNDGEVWAVDRANNCVVDMRYLLVLDRSKPDDEPGDNHLTYRQDLRFQCYRLDKALRNARASRERNPAREPFDRGREKTCAGVVAVGGDAGS